MAPDREFDVLVVGAGPAGIAAALAAVESRKRVGVVDDNPAPGGQIWRGESNPAIERLRSSSAALLMPAVVFDAPRPGVLALDSAGEALELGYEKLILSCGAREMWIPFPGWTLPNVTGAGGLQALVKAGLPIAGKKIVLAGSGPLLPAVGALLAARKARVLLIAEQARQRRLNRFAATLLRHPGKAAQALGLRWRLRRTPYATSCWPVEARGDDRVREVALEQDGRPLTLACDYLGCGFGLVPNTELAELLGCAVDESGVRTDALQQTSRPGIYCAGEAGGVGGAELAEAEGAIAGYAAAGDEAAARRRFGARRRSRRFAEALNRAFALRDELRALPNPETVVCRCEDVRWTAIRGHDDWRETKLQTRAGMGPCQGRVCGPALRFLAGVERAGVRPPLYPTPVERLAAKRRGDPG